MAQVMMICPKTSKPFPVGMNMDRGTFERSTIINNSITCPHCGEQHTYSKKDVFLQGDEKKLTK